MSELSTASALRAVPAGTWRLDQAASTVAFQHKSVWNLVTVNGTFPVAGGEGTVAPDGTASGRLAIDVAALDTAHAKRDKHLRSADFFDTDRFPTIDFTADEITPVGTTGAQVKGWLTVRGVTKPITLTAASTLVGDRTVTLSATVDFDRADYGMTWNQLGMIRGKATITLNLRFTLAD